MKQIYNKQNESILVPDDAAKRLVRTGDWSMTPPKFKKPEVRTRKLEKDENG